MSTVGVITGNGFYQLTRMEKDRRDTIQMDGEDVVITRGQMAGHEIVHLGRHGGGNKRLPHQVTHLANMRVMAELEVDFILGMTVVGIVDPGILPGLPIFFDDLYFPENRLADGRVCTRFQTEGYTQGGGHFLWKNVFCRSLREELMRVLLDPKEGMDFISGGTYGHLWGPRMMTPSEIRQLNQLGIKAVSQTAGPEPVLAAEFGIPYALIGFGFAGPAHESYQGELIRENLAQVPHTFGEMLNLFLRKGDLDRIEFDQGALFRFNQ